MNKKLSALITISVLLLNLSCGKEQVRKISTLPPSTIDQFKEQGFAMVYGNAYPSVGKIAKDIDNQGKNNNIEIDNPFKFNLNGKTFHIFLLL